MITPRSIVAAVLAAAAAASALAAQHPLITLPLADPAYAQLEGLARSGCGAARVSPYRPYLVHTVRVALGEAKSESACRGVLLDALVARFGAGNSSFADSAFTSGALGAGGELGLRATALGNGEFRPLWRDVRASADGSPSVVGIARGRVTWSGGQHLVAVSQLYAQSDMRNDPLVRARTFRTTKGVLDFDEAYLAGRTGPFVLSVGRSRDAWLGNGEESLVLAAHGPPMDRVAASARWDKWEIRALFGSIDDVVLDSVGDALAPGVGTQRVHRMLAAHAITYRPSSVWEFTLGETAVIGRRGSGIDLAFANPAMLYIMTEHDTSRTGPGADDDNLTAFGAVRLHLGRTALTGELLVDDIQIDAKDRAVTQDQLGWHLAGSYALPLAAPAALVVDYERLGSYTYLRRYYSLVYQQYGQPLGSELGPDAERVRGGAELWPSDRLRLAGGVTLWRRGAQRIDERPGVTAVGMGGQSFPSQSVDRPYVQRTWMGDLSGEWLDAIIPITVRAELAHVDNVNNVPGARGTYLRIHFAGSYRFRYP
ncbi:MAG: capsule assembly Wzi family protein [Gemmatimonadaceae bacterium]